VPIAHFQTRRQSFLFPSCSAVVWWFGKLGLVNFVHLFRLTLDWYTLLNNCLVLELFAGRVIAMEGGVVMGSSALLLNGSI
jgi:hypothetical protein